MAAALRSESKKRRHRAEAGTNTSRATKAVKVDAEPPAKLDLEPPAGSVLLQHPEMRRLRELAEAKQADVLGEQQAEVQVRQMAAEAGMDEAALAAPGPWYCANPFSRTCSREKNDAVEYYGKFDSARGCLRACTPPRGIEELVAVYGPPDTMSTYQLRDLRVPRLIGPQPEGQVLPSRAPQQMDTFSLSRKYEQLQRDSDIAADAVRGLLHPTPSTVFGLRRADAQQRWELLTALIDEGRGFLAAAPALLAALKGSPSVYDEIQRIIRVSFNSTWRKWLVTGAFSAPQAIQDLDDALMNFWTQAVPWTRREQHPQLERLAELIRYVPADMQDELRPAFSDPRMLDGYLLSLGDAPLVQEYIRLFGCRVVLNLANSLYRIGGADHVAAAYGTYRDLHALQYYADVVRQYAKACGIFASDVTLPTSEAELDWVSARYLRQIVVPQISMDNAFRKSLLDSSEIADMPSVTTSFVNARRVLLEGLQADLAKLSTESAAK